MLSVRGRFSPGRTHVTWTLRLTAKKNVALGGLVSACFLPAVFPGPGTEPSPEPSLTKRKTKES